MLTKHCHCGALATVEMNLVYYCSKHAFERIMATDGPVPRLRPAK